MIKIETISTNIIKITSSEKLSADDFKNLAPHVDAVIQQYGKVRLLIDATHMGGWENNSAFEKHVGFIKNHHSRVERVAVIIGHDWQHWIVSLAAAFLHPEIKAFTSGEETAATEWIMGT